MRLAAAAPELVASEDHAWIAWLGDRLTLLDSDSRRVLATAALPAAAQLAFLGRRLVALAPSAQGGATQLTVLALPTLETVAQGELEGRAQLLAATGSRLL